MKYESVTRILLFAAMLCIVAGKAWSQASLLAENVVNDADINITAMDGSTVQQTYTLVRDAHNEGQWYYYPNQPRLAERVVNGKATPELSFIKYTYKSTDSQIQERALLTFAITLSAKSEVVDKLRGFLISRLQSQDRSTVGLRLSPIPMNSASALVYSPKIGNLIAEGPANEIQSSGIEAGTNANSKIVFALMLTDVGADVYDALLNGTGGIPIFISYKYNGLTPPAGFKVTANWDLAYQYYSKNERFRARASYYGLFSANYESNRQYIREELNKSGAIKINGVTSETFNQKDRLSGISRGLKV